MPATPPDPLPTADLPNDAKADATHSLTDPAALTGTELSSFAVAEPLPTSPTRYTLGDEIAHGGMGIVYWATDTTLNRKVALKVLQNKYALNSAVARRFSDEARIAAQLQHPAIPPIHDLGTLADGRPFLAMKLIKGATLEDSLASRRDPDFDRGHFLAAFEQICQAIAYAHAHSVIHRDLKPANIMLGSFGVVQVMDWGLAKVLRNAESKTEHEDPDATSAGTEIHSIRDSDGMHTQAGSVLGTPAFMPPEQAVGAIGQIDERSDVFGLGAILAVILTGQPPFVGGTAETTRILAAQGKVEGCLARLDACGADPGLVALCKRCLAPLQTDRPRDASEVAKAVAELRAAADERARQAELDRARAEAEVREQRIRAESERAKAQEQRKRRRVQMILAAVVVFMLFGVGAFGWWQDRQAAAQRDRLARNAESVTTLVDQTEEALKADDADRAEVALTQAEKRIGDGGADSSKTRLDRLRAGLILLRELDKIDNKRWTHVDGRYPDPITLVPLWAGAFADFGIVPGTTSVEEAATLLSESAIRDRALAALDHWLMATPSTDVATLLSFADSDPFRTEIREAIRTRNANRVRELAQTEAALAQPAWFVALTNPVVPVDRRRVLLERALATRPGNLTLLMGLGNLNPMNHREGAEERIRWYQAAASTHPRNLAAWNMLGSALGDKGNLDGAMACYKEAIRLDPNDAHPHNNLGNMLKVKGDLDGAMTCYKEALRLDPKYPPAHNGIGWVLLDKGELDSAITYIKEALRLDSKYPPAHNNMGWTLWNKGEADAAITYIKEAIRLDPNWAPAHNNMGLILWDKGERDRSIACFKEAIRLDPNYASAHNNMGNVLKSKGDLDGAMASYMKARQLDPKLANAHYGLGMILTAKDNLDGAIACFQEAIRLDPKFAPAHNGLGSALGNKRDPDGAIASFREAIRLDAKFARYHYNLGIALKTKGAVDEAIVCHKKAIQLDPEFALAYNGLGFALGEKGDLDGAILCFQKAIQLDPEFALAHNHLGITLKLKGNLNEAVASFKEAIQLEPKNIQAQRNLIQTQQWQSLLPQLDEIVDGRNKPRTPTEACNFALLCMQTFRKQYGAATRLYTNAFADNPKLVNDLDNVHRYNAACCAALAGCGKGVDAPDDVDARLALRHQSLEWLRADLTSLTSLARSNPAARQFVAQQMGHWLVDTDLMGVRPGPDRIKMSTKEQGEWDALWMDVRALLAETQKPTSPRPTAPPPREVK